MHIDKSRYVRQIKLPELGEEGQKRLAGAKVLLVGAGGLGSAAAIYLAAAGVGRISIADSDEVRLNNLNRQILYNESDLGKAKAVRAKSYLERFNSEINIEVMSRIDESNINNILTKIDYDVLIDGTDNFETRYTLNNACIVHKIPFVFGSVLGWVGQVSVFDSGKGPCYQCIYPEAPSPEDSPTCTRAGVIGVATGAVGVLEACEGIKIILDKGETLTG